MTRSGEEIVAHIDATLDQLIQNASVIKQLSNNKQYEEELMHLQKTQESLLSHLMHMDELLGHQQKKKQQIITNDNSKAVKTKLVKLSRLNAQVVKRVSKSFVPKRKKRKKTLLKSS